MKKKVDKSKRSLGLSKPLTVQLFQEDLDGIELEAAGAGVSKGALLRNIVRKQRKLGRRLADY